MVQFVKELFRYHETSVLMGHQLVQTLNQLGMLEKTIHSGPPLQL